MEFPAAVGKAIDDCLRQGILTDVLISSKMEVLDMLLEEYNEQETREYLRRKAIEMGREEGREEGQKIGKNKINELNRKLIQENRLEDLKRAANDETYQNELLKEYGL